MTSDGMAHWLEGLPDQQLVHLIRARLGRAPRVPTSFNELGTLLSHVHSCDEALRHLDRTAVQVVAVLSEAGGRLTVDELAGKLGSHPTQVAEALQRASDLALAWPVPHGGVPPVTDEGTVWRTAGGLAHVAGSVLRRGVPYRALLPELRLAALRALMKTQGLSGGRSTWDAAEILADVLPQRLPALLAAAPTGTADALCRLLQDQNEGPPDLLAWAQEHALILWID